MCPVWVVAHAQWPSSSLQIPAYNAQDNAQGRNYRRYRVSSCTWALVTGGPKPTLPHKTPLLIGQEVAITILTL